MQQFPVTGENVRIFGRTIRIDDALWLGWSGSGIEFTTDASEVTIEIMAITPTGAEADVAYLGLILDDDEEHLQRIRVERGRHRYTLLSNFALRRHTIQLVKLSEARNDKVGLVSITADTPLVPTVRPARRILFVGDSITAGYGIDCDDPAHYDGRTTAVQNVTRAYSWQTARALGAEGQYIAWSGNGVISHFIDPDTDLPESEDLMPAMYPYTDRATEEIVRIYLSAHGHHEDIRQHTVFDPQEFVPDVIVSYLGTNDASFTRGIPSRERHFTERYAELLRALRADYPKALCIVLYGTMERGLTGAVETAALLAGAQYLELPYIDVAADGIGAVSHPSARTHERIATQLTAFIKEHTNW